MNGLWLWLSGSYRIRLTGAEPERTVGMLARFLCLNRMERESDLCVEFWVSRKDIHRLKELTKSSGDRIEILEERGLPVRIRCWKEYPVLTTVLILLMMLTHLLPGKILFLRVEGNQRVPEALILERAAECGLSFWTDRQSLRSEQIKNRLLSALPELSWVGVNTTGSVAVISVQERNQEHPADPDVPGNVVSALDAIVTEITAESGHALVASGDAVKAGQILISGYTDLGLCTHVEAARGEVYGMTQRQTAAVIPVKTWIQGQRQPSVKKYSLIIGKKRINFYSDSGILYAGCGKMTQIRYLYLPGGWRLPVALVTECYEPSDWTEAERWEPSGRDVLMERSLAQLNGQMRSGEILAMETAYERPESVQRLILRCTCREMIGRQSNGIITEGDMQYDRENGERGAG